MKPSTSTHKSRVSEEDIDQLTPLYAIKISESSAPVPSEMVDEYETNKEQQAANYSLSKRPQAYQFLKCALEQPLDDLRRYLWTNGYDEECSDEDKIAKELIRLILTDYTANCMKPVYPTPTNERTPYVESIVPIFKYLSAVMGTVAFVW